MPLAAVEPSGTLVELLCGQPEQKYGVRLAPAISVSANWMSKTVTN